ncbi:MAG: hypothetical protein UR93_C0032G0003 [Berkelbacteria bacterium GW2011_GWA2_35_9]|uniref:Uncharacterized protein n=1 Tax=Berkelbacteria bacterium GW2011_GWA2_35_9 TaxID=1618333 RepID=A0A0G0G7S7_9BACT|nr:MAG: hypothetical protein UR93_C0032G0003 [Berkelbacteria bacterium GW2011_GWA2_35_9]
MKKGGLKLALVLALAGAGLLLFQFSSASSAQAAWNKPSTWFKPKPTNTSAPASKPATGVNVRSSTTPNNCLINTNSSNATQISNINRSSAQTFQVADSQGNQVSTDSTTWTVVETGGQTYTQTQGKTFTVTFSVPTTESTRVVESQNPRSTCMVSFSDTIGNDISLKVKVRDASTNTLLPDATVRMSVLVSPQTYGELTSVNINGDYVFTSPLDDGTGSHNLNERIDYYLTVKKSNYVSYDGWNDRFWLKKGVNEKEIKLTPYSPSSITLKTTTAQTDDPANAAEVTDYENGATVYVYALPTKSTQLKQVRFYLDDDNNNYADDDTEITDTAGPNFGAFYPNLAVGDHTIKAYPYNTKDQKGATVVKKIRINPPQPTNIAPTVSIESLYVGGARKDISQPVKLNSGDSVDFSIRSSDTDGNLQKVELYQASQAARNYTASFASKSISGNSSVDTFNHAFADVGNFVVKAVARDSEGLSADSQEIQINVEQKPNVLIEVDVQLTNQNGVPLGGGHEVKLECPGIKDYQFGKTSASGVVEFAVSLEENDTQSCTVTVNPKSGYQTASKAVTISANATNQNIQIPITINQTTADAKLKFYFIDQQSKPVKSLDVTISDAIGIVAITHVDDNGEAYVHGLKVGKEYTVKPIEYRDDSFFVESGSFLVQKLTIPGDYMGKTYSDSFKLTLKKIPGTTTDIYGAYVKVKTSSGASVWLNDITISNRSMSMKTIVDSLYWTPILYDPQKTVAWGAGTAVTYSYMSPASVQYSNTVSKTVTYNPEHIADVILDLTADDFCATELVPTYQSGAVQLPVKVCAAHNQNALGYFVTAKKHFLPKSDLSGWEYNQIEKFKEYSPADHLIELSRKVKLNWDRDKRGALANYILIDDLDSPWTLYTDNVDTAYYKVDVNLLTAWSDKISSDDRVPLVDITDADLRKLAETVQSCSYFSKQSRFLTTGFTPLDCEVQSRKADFGGNNLKLYDTLRLFKMPELTIKTSNIYSVLYSDYWEYQNEFNSMLSSITNTEHKTAVDGFIKHIKAP